MFDTLIREELGSQVELDPQGNGAQISTSGPPGIPLPSAIVQTLALALHELTTNAVKYGALADTKGHLDVQWRVETLPDASPRLRVEWTESGVSCIPEPGAGPEGGGYGRELIERALPYQLGARTTYGFNTDGVHCTIEVPVPIEQTASEVQP